MGETDMNSTDNLLRTIVEFRLLETWRCRRGHDCLMPSHSDQEWREDHCPECRAWARGMAEDATIDMLMEET
jgi:hypothetical protein